MQVVPTTFNINELQIVDNIQNGYFILVETPWGTGLIDYENFVIGTNNITFSPLLSSFGTDIIALSSQIANLTNLINSLSSQI
jgi:hypothetical protein